MSATMSASCRPCSVRKMSIGQIVEGCSSTLPAHSSRSRLNTGKVIDGCGASESRCVRIATDALGIGGLQPNSSRRRTSSACQRLARSGPVTAAAPSRSPVWLRRARHDVALVEMGMGIEHAGQDQRAVEVGAELRRDAAGGGDLGDLAVLDHEIAEDEIVLVDRPRRRDRSATLAGTCTRRSA